MSTKQNDETQSRWYMVNKDGMATLCADQADAEQEAKNAQEVWPHMGPHRAVRLVEVGDAGFTASDMATAAAQGFREGQAEELAAMRAGGEPVAYCDERVIAYLEDARSRDSLITTILAKERSYERPTPLYTHPKPAAQDAERYRLLNLGVDVIQADDEFLSDDTTTWATDPNGVFVGMPYQGYALLPARRKLVAAIAAQQGDSNDE